MYETFVQNILPAVGTALGVIITALAAYFIAFLNKKKEELQGKIDNETASKYLDMLMKTIEDCVRATNQTYVEALKKENAFTPEAQKEAFQKTLDAVLGILGEDCLEYLGTITGDIQTYLMELIESEVNKQKAQ